MMAIAVQIILMQYLYRISISYCSYVLYVNVYLSIYLQSSVGSLTRVRVGQDVCSVPVAGNRGIEEAGRGAEATSPRRTEH